MTMENRTVPGQLLAKVMGIGLSCIALAQVGVLSMILATDSFGASGVAIRNQLSGFDVVTLYISAVLLLVAMIQLLRMKKSSLRLLFSYIGIGSWVALVYSFMPRSGGQFNELAAVGGVVLMSVISAFVLRLQWQGALH